jgi:hypothetical protein
MSDDAAVQNNTEAAVDESAELDTGVIENNDAGVADDGTVVENNDEFSDDDVISVTDDDEEDESSSEDDSDDEGVPESYGDFEFPEGFGPDDEITTQFKELAKGMNLTQKQAQKLVDLQVESVKRALAPEQISDSVLEAWDTIIDNQRTSWSKQLRSDKDLGGVNLDSNLKIANRTLAQFGSPALKEALKESGWSSNPELVRLLVRVGGAISEDSLGAGIDNTGISREKSAAVKLYPNEA